MDTRAAAAETTRARILEAAMAAFTAHWYDEVTLRGVASDAGVALQTVRNHFAGKEELFLAATEAMSERVTSTRFSVEPGDVDTAVAALVDDYDRTGDAVLRLLAVESRVPVVEPVLARGREGHEAWVQHVFAAALTGLRGKARARRVAELVVATDVYAWKLLRRDRRMTRDETIAAIRELVLALHEQGKRG